MILKNVCLLVLIILLSIFLLSFGETGLNFDSVIVWQLRLPKVVVCLMSGGMLALAGLLMQVFFQNPLAGPDILGISSGSSLFVALWTMASASLSPFLVEAGASLMSFLGALVVFLFLLFFVQRSVSRVSLIIIGLLISSFVSSGISILLNFSQALQIKNFLLWSMGSFRNVSSPDLPRFLILSLVSVIPVFLFQKSLNQFLLSENYARSMGVNVKQMRFIFITLAALIISIVTMFTGPVGFIGIISPHLARLFLKEAQLRSILPATFMVGSILALIAEVIIVLIPGAPLSVNAILGLIGAPVIIVYVYHQREWGQ